jgi:hypothetical protein
MVHAHQLLSPQQAEGPRGYGYALERRAHAGAFGVAYAVDVIDRDACFLEGLGDEARDEGPVVEGNIFGKEALSGCTVAWLAL